MEAQVHPMVMAIPRFIQLWVTSLSDTPRLQYYDVQTLEYRYISKLIISPSIY
jgi:hypothetical protein